jgi:hypothetical protein
MDRGSTEKTKSLFIIMKTDDLDLTSDFTVYSASQRERKQDGKSTGIGRLDYDVVSTSRELNDVVRQRTSVEKRKSAKSCDGVVES